MRDWGEENRECVIFEGNAKATLKHKIGLFACLFKIYIYTRKEEEKEKENQKEKKKKKKTEETLNQHNRLEIDQGRKNKIVKWKIV